MCLQRTSPAQLDTDVNCEVTSSMEVIPETNVDQTEAAQPILSTSAQVDDEMDPGSDGSQDTDDGNAPDDSQDTDDENAPSSSSSQDDASESRVLNEALGVSPISKRKVQRHGNSYRQKKIKGILNCLSKKLGVNPSPDIQKVKLYHN